MPLLPAALAHSAALLRAGYTCRLLHRTGENPLGIYCISCVAEALRDIITAAGAAAGGGLERRRGLFAETSGGVATLLSFCAAALRAYHRLLTCYWLHAAATWALPSFRPDFLLLPRCCTQHCMLPHIFHLPPACCHRVLPIACFLRTPAARGADVQAGAGLPWRCDICAHIASLHLRGCSGDGIWASQSKVDGARHSLRCGLYAWWTGVAGVCCGQAGHCGNVSWLQHFATSSPPERTPSRFHRRVLPPSFQLPGDGAHCALQTVFGSKQPLAALALAFLPRGCHAISAIMAPGACCAPRHAERRATTVHLRRAASSFLLRLLRETRGVRYGWAAPVWRAGLTLSIVADDRAAAAAGGEAPAAARFCWLTLCWWRKRVTAAHLAAACLARGDNAFLRSACTLRYVLRHPTPSVAWTWRTVPAHGGAGCITGAERYRRSRVGAVPAWLLLFYPGAL